MAEYRRLADLNVGYPGVIAYLPSKDPQNEPGVLHTTRLTTQGPNFRPVGHPEEWYPPSRINISQIRDHSWEARRTQERWLANSHPSALIGGADTVSELLGENADEATTSQSSGAERPLLAVGEMADLRNPSRVTGMPLLAAATGESGEKLRLTRMDDSVWQWDEHEDVFLHRLAIDTVYQETENVWEGDGLPILQIKFATSRRAYGTLRWLMVQTQASITILQPQFHQTPLPGAVQPESYQPPSCLEPNPRAKLRRHEAGGNEWSDFCFCPPSSDSPPRIAVIDVHGFWSVWNASDVLRKGKDSLQLTLHRRGHIAGGILRSVPRNSSYPAQRHGILPAGRSQNDGNRRAASMKHEGKTNSGPSAPIFLWNAQGMALLDLETDSILALRSDILARARGHPDRVLDVQTSQTYDHHVYVLTTKQVIWIDLSPSSADPDVARGPSILLTCSHVGVRNEDALMSLCTESADQASGDMVFVYSPHRDQTIAHWFSLAQHSQLPQRHRYITTLTSADHKLRGATQLLRVLPVELEVPSAPGKLSSSSSPSPGSEYARDKVKFYQVISLAEDLSVHSQLCASWKDPALEVTPPSCVVSWQQAKQASSHQRRRRLFLRHLGDTFVVPDALDDDMMGAVMEGRRVEPTSGTIADDTQAPEPRTITLRLGRLCELIASSLQDAISRGPMGLPSDLSTVVQRTLDGGLSEGSLPLASWMQLFPDTQQRMRCNGPEDGMETDLEALLDRTDDRAVITQLRRRGADEPPDSFLGYPFLARQFSELWLDTAAAGSSLPEDLQRIRQIWVHEIARDVFLASYGVMVQDVPLLGGSSADVAGDSQTEPRQKPSSSRPSQQSPRIAASSPASSASGREVPDAAFRRLRLLAPTIELGALGLLEQAPVLSYWPAEGGVDTDDYVSSIAVATEEKFSHARRRLQRIEAKRKAQAERYRLPSAAGEHGADEGAGSSSRRRPAPVQIMSSQQAFPNSSQSQGVLGPTVTMSQPVAGAFGDRKKVKKGKRKSGFR